MAAGLLISATLAIFGNKNPGNGIAEAVVRPKISEKPLTKSFASPSSSTGNGIILTLKPRKANTPEVYDEGTGQKKHELFSTHSWSPPPPPPPPIAKQQPPKPQAPPLPFTYLGKMVEGNREEIYLGKGEQTYIVQEKTVIEGAYRVESIKPTVITFVYLPLNQSQTLSIEKAN